MKNGLTFDERRLICSVMYASSTDMCVRGVLFEEPCQLAVGPPGYWGQARLTRSPLLRRGRPGRTLQVWYPPIPPHVPQVWWRYAKPHKLTAHANGQCTLMQ